ncbi:hypothetical protein ACMXYQ_13205 [Neptuniibacter sp. PT34_22]|uniref:hypothetical protein n=1 Tax=Neptuniibacter sp. PT34_22 TaxID=3398205 RepID=UPI0039F4536F
MELMFVVLCAAIVMTLSTFMFARGKLWQELRQFYPCEYKESNKGVKVKGRFLYCVDGDWMSNNYIHLSFDENFVYLNVTRPFGAIAKPIKVHKSELVYEGTKRYFLYQRNAYSLLQTQRIKLAFPTDLNI